MNEARSLNDAFVVIKRELLWATDRPEVKTPLQPFMLVRDPRSPGAYGFCGCIRSVALRYSLA
jgi:hypothetical protein